MSIFLLNENLVNVRVTIMQEVATYSSTLAWRIPWTEEPGGLQFMGSERDTTEPLHFHFHIYVYILYIYGFPRVASGKEPVCQCRRPKSHSLILGSGRSPGGAHGDPLQYSCLENPYGQRSLAGYSPLGHKESDMTEVT